MTLSSAELFSKIYFVYLVPLLIFAKMEHMPKKDFAKSRR